MTNNECLDELKNSVTRIEQYLGLVTDKFPLQNTITAKITANDLSSIVPMVEVNIPISDNQFITNFYPEKIGDSWVINDQISIYNGVYYTIHQGISFEKNICTINSEVDYTNNFATVSYFFNPKIQNNLFYGVRVQSGNILIEKTDLSKFNLVIQSDNFNWNLTITETGELVSEKTTASVSGNNIFLDIDNPQNKYLITINDSGIISCNLF